MTQLKVVQTDNQLFDLWAGLCSGVGCIDRQIQTHGSRQMEQLVG